MPMYKGEKILFRSYDRDEAALKAKDLGARMEARNKPDVKNQERKTLWIVIGYDDL